MYTMKEICEKLDLSYGTLRFYCNEGLIPNIKRDSNNYRKFDERDLNWMTSLMCLKRCGMSIKDMKSYMHLCQQGVSSIKERKEILDVQRKKIVMQIEKMQKNIDFIDTTQHYFDEVLANNIAYTSNLIDVE